MLAQIPRLSRQQQANDSFTTSKAAIDAIVKNDLAFISWVEAFWFLSIEVKGSLLKALF